MQISYTRLHAIPRTVLAADFGSNSTYDMNENQLHGLDVWAVGRIFEHK